MLYVSINLSCLFVVYLLFVFQDRVVCVYKSQLFTCCLFVVYLLFVFQDRSNAQVSCAGLFIGSHLGFDYPGIWLHIDMASPVYVVSTECWLATGLNYLTFD